VGASGPGSFFQLSAHSHIKGVRQRLLTSLLTSGLRKKSPPPSTVKGVRTLQGGQAEQVNKKKLTRAIGHPPRVGFERSKKSKLF